MQEKSSPEARAIRRKLRILSEPKNLAKSKEILSTDKEVIGTPTRELKRIAKEFWHSFRLNSKKYFDLCLELWGGSHEEQMVVAYSLFQAIKQEPETIEFIINDLSFSISDWAVADTLGKVLSEYFCLKKNEELMDKLFTLYYEGNELQKRLVLSFLAGISCQYNDPLLVNKILDFIEKQFPAEEYSSITLKGIQRIMRELNKHVPAKSYASILYWVESEKLRSKKVLKGMVSNLPLKQREELIKKVEKRKKK